MINFNELIKINFPNNFLILFTLFVIISYPSGPFFPDLLLSISALIFAFFLIKKKNYLYLNNSYSLFFFVFFLYIITNSLFALLPAFSLRSSLFYFRFYLFSLMIWYLLENEKSFKFIFYKVILFTVIFVNFDGIFQYFFGQDLFGFEKLEHRLSGPFGDELIIGSYLSKTVPVLIALGYYLEKNNYNFLFGILTISLFTVFLSGERASFFFMFSFYIFFLIITLSKKNLKIIIPKITILFVILLTVLIVDKSRFDRMIKFPICAMNLDYISILNCDGTVPTSADKSIDRPIIFSEAHEGHYLAAIKMFKDSPFFGKGIKMFRYHCNDIKFKNPHSCTSHPHNILLQILAELGLVGLIFLIVILYKIYKSLILVIINKKKITQNKRISFLLINFLLVQLFFIFLPSGQIFNNYLSILYYIPLGIYFFLEKKLTND